MTKKKTQEYTCEKFKVNEINKIFKNSKYKLIEYDNAHNITVEDEEGYMYNTSIYNINKNQTVIIFSFYTL